MKIGIDMDDVCDNFQKRFVEVLHSLHGKPELGTSPVDWQFSNSGLTEKQIEEGWAETRRIHNFWSHIEPLPSFDSVTKSLLCKANTRHDVYFITNRYDTAGSSPLKQTKYWLYLHAYIQAPNVIISKDNKGSIANLLQLDAFIDDRPKNCIEVLRDRPSTKVYLVDSSHNQTFYDKDIPRVRDLKEALKLLLEAN